MTSAYLNLEFCSPNIRWSGRKKQVFLAFLERRRSRSVFGNLLNKPVRDYAVAIGEPWVRGSNCTHMLVSLPYPYGTDFELCAIGDGHLHIYWLLPITEREHDYKVGNGADALEEVFETKGLEYWKTKRKSVI